MRGFTDLIKKSYFSNKRKIERKSYKLLKAMFFIVFIFSISLSKNVFSANKANTGNIEQNINRLTKYKSAELEMTGITPQAQSDVIFNKMAEWVDIEKGIAKLTIVNSGITTSEPIDTVLVVDNSLSMKLSTWCNNEAHWTTGSHINDQGSSSFDANYGCPNNMILTQEVLKKFTDVFLGYNTENRIAIISFARTAIEELNFSNNESEIIYAIEKMTGGFETNYEAAFNQARTTIENRNIIESGIAEVNSRKTSLIFLTDGAPTSTNVGLETSNIMKNNGVSIYSIRIRS